MGRTRCSLLPSAVKISQTKANLIHLLMLIMNIDNIMSVKWCVYSGVQNSIDNFVLCRALSEPHCPKCNRETKYKLKGFMSSGAWMCSVNCTSVCPVWFWYFYSGNPWQILVHVVRSVVGLDVQSSKLACDGVEMKHCDGLLLGVGLLYLR